MTDQSSTSTGRQRVAALTILVSIGAVSTATFVSLAPSGTSTRPASQTAPSEGPLPASQPTQLRIDRLDLVTRVVRLSPDANQVMKLPPLDRAGWDITSRTPGEPGVAVLAGYIRRSPQEPGVFSRLGRLRVGDTVDVRRKDDRTVTYEVTEIESYAAGDFPAQRVYADTNEPALRIVTTGGALRRGAPLGNVVVYATESEKPR